MFKAATGAVYRRPKALAGGPRQVLSNLLRDGNTVADYQPGNYTGTLNASAWANSIGAAGSLLQATGANQPIILSSDYVKKAYLPAVSGNYFSSPDSIPASITGDIAIVMTMAMNDWTPVALQVPISKDGVAGGTRSYVPYVNTDGTLHLIWSANGTAVIDKGSTVAPTVTDGDTLTWAVSLDVDNGAGGNDVKFFVLIANVWTQLGTTVTTAGTTSIADTNALLNIGANSNGTVNLMAGKMFSASIYNGIPPILGGTASASPVVSFNASDWSETSTNGATQASSTTGETWTLNNTGAKLAQITASPQLLFDGAAHFMKAAPFTFVQPEEIWVVGKIITWTSGDQIFDGDAALSGTVFQSGVTPAIVIYAGSSVASNTSWVLNTKGIMTAVINGASSSIQIDTNAATTGNAGAANMGGFTLGALATGLTQWANMQVYEVILRNTPSGAALRASIQSLLKSIYGTP